jgi:predicted HTH domain antitoxin
MISITVQCPDEVLISLKEDAESFSRELPLAAAMKLYELGRLSSGRAAQLAGLSRVAFLSRTSEYRVPIFDATAEELQEDVRNA